MGENMIEPSDKEYWIVQIGEGKYSRVDVAYFYEDRWYEIEHGEYVPECNIIDDVVMPLSNVLDNYD